MTTTTTAPLTARQREILAWVDAYIRDHGFSPTVRELCRAFKFKSNNGAMCHLQPLRRKGHITWIDGNSRTLRVVSQEVSDGL